MKKFLYKLLFYKKYKTILDINKISKILVLRYDRIGDLIVTLPLIETIKSQYPNINIDIVASDINKDILYQHPNINKIFIYNFRDKKNIFQFIKVFKQLRKEKYDVVIDPFFNNHSRSAGHLRAINAKFNIGVEKKNKYGLSAKDFKLFYDFSTFDKTKHLLTNIINISKILKINEENFIEKVTFPFYDEDKKANFFLKNYIGKNIIIFNIQGSTIQRSFNDDFIIYFSQKLATNKNNQIILICMPNRRKKLEEMIKQGECKNIITAKTKNIREAISLLKYSNLVISPDTSIVHGASNYSKTIISFYKNDDFNQTIFSPYKTEYKIFNYDNLFQLNKVDADYIFKSIKEESFSI